MGSWWLSGAVFPPRPTPVTWHYPSPQRRRSSVLGVRPVRVERHNPCSIATLRQTIARVVLRQLSRCPFCGTGFLYHSSTSGPSLFDKLPRRMTTAPVLRILLTGLPNPAATRRKCRTQSKCHHPTFRKLRSSPPPQPVCRKSRPMSCVAPCGAEPPPPKPSPRTAASSPPSFVSARWRR